MSTIIGIRDAGPNGAVAAAIVSADMNGGIYSPAKEKAATRGAYATRSHLVRRLRSLVGASKLKLIVCVVVFSVVVLITSRLSSAMGWVPFRPTPSTSRGFGYTVLINTWKRSSVLKQSIGHYASCGGVDAIRVAWSDGDPPSESLKSHLEKMAFSKFQAAKKPYFNFGISQDNDLNGRFKPIQGLTYDAVFSVDDNVIAPCATLDFAFTVWQSAPKAMVGFVPRMHWLDKEVSSRGRPATRPVWVSLKPYSGIRDRLELRFVAGGLTRHRRHLLLADQKVFGRRPSGSGTYGGSAPVNCLRERQAVPFSQV